MVDYRQNNLSKKWIIVSPKRAKRPGENKKEAKPVCPFCYGHESMTPPEVYRIGEGNPGEPGWKVRVVPNKYKITDIHEVIIHHPNHDFDFEDLPEEHANLVFEVYKNRFNFHKDQGQVVIFNNCGKEAAESLEHNHTQLAVVPANIKLDTPVIGEINLAYEDDQLLVSCPRDSEWPYEVWFIPKRRDLSFGDINSDEIVSFSRNLKKVINIINRDVGEFSYNFYIYPSHDWYLRLIPRITNRAGFELSTGIMVNTKDPQEVVNLLKQNL